MCKQRSSCVLNSTDSDWKFIKIEISLNYIQREIGVYEYIYGVLYDSIVYIFMTLTLIIKVVSHIKFPGKGEFLFIPPSTVT